MSIIRTWMSGRRLMTLLGVIIAMTITGLVVVPPASAAVSIRTSYGVSVEGHHFGYYTEVYNRHSYQLICVSFDAGLDRGQSLSTIRTWSHIGTTRSEEVEYVLNRYGNTRSNTQAAAVYDAVNRIVGGSSHFAAVERHAPYSVRLLATEYVRNAQRYHGPYRVAITANSVLVGQAGTATITLKSAAGYGVSGLVELSAANATIARYVRTSSSGVVRVRFTRTGDGTVRLYARGLSVAPTTMVFSHPGWGQQQLLSWSPSTNTAVASTSFQKSVVGTVSYNCTTTCNGQPPVSYTWCHAAYEATRLYHVLDNGRVVKTVEIARSTRSACITATVIIPDTHKASATCSYYNSVTHRWNSAVACGPTVKVNCPPWPVVTETLSCNCTSGNIVLSLPANTTTHVEAINYSVNGAAQPQKTVVPGATLSVNIPFNRTAGDTDVVFNGAVQRSNGAWNVGGNEEVIVRKI